MLVLTRKPNEAVILKHGDVEIRVVLMELGMTRVRLGFDAPKDVEIMREELVQPERSD